MGEDRVDTAVVLVEPRNAGNVGLVARTMANFGVARLVLAGSTELPAEKDQLAARAEGRPILDALVRAADLAAALADEQVTIAVTRRTGKERPGDLFPATLAEFRAGLPPGTRVAFVFGRESDGLRTDEARLCARRLRIATTEEAPSLNLAQAVAVVLGRWYESVAAAGPGTLPTRRGIPPSPVNDPLASNARFEEMMAALEPALRAIGYLEGDRDEDTMNSLRRLFGRAQLTEREIRMLRGLATKIGKGRE
ncbi:MAG TPA: TrmH family RNA methyltransferase [Candidatus Eisenbacteria bacterium]